MSDYVLLNSGAGHRTKSYGPKCLFKLADKQSLLQRQLDQIASADCSAQVHVSVGFDSKKILKKFPNLSYAHNNEYEHTNQVYSVLSACDALNLSEGYFLFGDIVANHLMLGPQPDRTTLYLSDNQDNRKVGITHRNDRAEYLMWSIENTWSEIVFLDSTIINFWRRNKEELARAFLIEGINSAIEHGLHIGVKQTSCSVIDIDKKSDLKLANKAFGIK